MTATETKQLFDTNEDFHEYVIKYCRTSGDTIEQALRKKIIKTVGEEYQQGGVNGKEITK